MGKGPVEPAKNGQTATGAGLAAVTELVGAFGPAGRRLQEALAALGEAPIGLDELVRRSGLSRRTIEDLLAAAAPDLDTRGHRYVLRPDRRRAYEEQFGYPEPQGDLDRSGVAGTVLTDLTRRRPAGSLHLDHVAATPETLVRRASWLGATYDLRRTRLVFLGDHDLTSLATGLLHPGLDAQVVDLDEDLLAYLETEARRLGLGVRCCYGDLRYGLPHDVTGWGDVIFTDPPYSPEGVALFARRGLDALRDRDFGQLVIAYGYGERHPTLGWKVQQSLGNLGLVYEAVLRGFNTYDGAQAIGSTSDLYVCRPTPRSWRLPRPAGGLQIYTRGRQASEARSPQPSAAVRDSALGLAGDGPRVVAGNGWTGSEATRHVRLGTLFETGVPPGWAKQVSAAVVDLSDDPGPWLLRSLLAINLPRVVLIVGEGHVELSGRARRLLNDLIKDKYRVSEPRPIDPASPFVLLEANQVTDDESEEGRLRGAVLRRAHGTLLNVWREGLIDVARRRGRRLTKNEARATVDAFAGNFWPSRLIDFSRHQVGEVLEALGKSVGELERRP